MLGVTTTRVTLSGSIDAGDDVLAHPAHVVLILVVADMREMRNPVAAFEDVVEAARRVEVGRVQGQAPGRVTRHRLQEAGAGGVADRAHAGSRDTPSRAGLTTQPPTKPAAPVTAMVPPLGTGAMFVLFSADPRHGSWLGFLQQMKV